MTINPDVIIIGGGLAGLTSALHLSKQGFNVTLIEKHDFPRHKVCGEYVSNEILAYLHWLQVDVESLYPTHIQELEFTTEGGQMNRVRLPLGGIGISRYALDDLLYQQAKGNGCTIVIATVTGISFSADTFAVSFQDQVLRSKIVLGAYGKRSNIDQLLSRDFITKTSPWMAVKAHYSGDFPNDLIALHHFEGGYCGISKVEDDRINLCYLADVKTFKRYKNIGDYQKYVLSKNRHLKYFFEHNRLLFEKPLTISQFSFDKKSTVENHILMIGDTAGLIHPFCGNGMAMAIHSAKIASELVLEYYRGHIHSRKQLEKAYVKQWNQTFKRRLLFGRLLSRLLSYKIGTAVLMKTASFFPKMLSWIIKQTHGNARSIKWE
ncbi:NAD(P)/FAD-dependent oxidoreductase [Sphingobacterium paramultivorum]|uniref:NAD(P)/FAD-dependent oxidoreductase n=1 Tax=Sphingobacterium paramultivorum TaxID=2886510 RepID=A0A7G5E2A9_9SPHI|nr:MULTISPECIES: NAD(P)/FAD-dependent oxidoreductase [Sphingobacterium]MCS4168104.1 flavin-dependent dehydrogenase [Sphingobacterium sp. BIGb0116]QMV68134.1 NAD(P)/FAD-dependent oxidoreductase [Sphingobacterium paramultivorum]WSO17046.1 NAD(P)/FAD-dependent oxidoreductase [Sphingobacterium paramultivorum]